MLFYFLNSKLKIITKIIINIPPLNKLLLIGGDQIRSHRN